MAEKTYSVVPDGGYYGTPAWSKSCASEEEAMRIVNELNYWHATKYEKYERVFRRDEEDRLLKAMSAAEEYRWKLEELGLTSHPAYSIQVDVSPNSPLDYQEWLRENGLFDVKVEEKEEWSGDA